MIARIFFFILCFAISGVAFADEQTTPISEPQITFTASKLTAVIGEPIVLSWSATDATRCETGGEWGYAVAKPVTGSETVVPKKGWIISEGVSKEKTLYHYYLYCFNGDVRGLKAVTLTVDPSRNFLTLSTSQKSSKAGDLITISWSANNADRCTASKGWSGEKSTSGGTELVKPEQTMTYALQCFAGSSSASKEVTISVAARRAPVITSFNSSKKTVAPSGQVTLSWQASATQCIARDEWTGVKALRDSETVTPANAMTTYTLECTRDGLLASRSIQVAVADGPGNMSVSVSKTLVRDGEPLLLSWSADSVDSCKGWGSGWSAKDLTSRGSVTVYPVYSSEYPQATYTVSCTRSGVTVGRTVVVVIQSDPFLTLTADPPTVDNPGQQSKISWSSSLAERCRASGLWSGEKQSVGQESVAPKSSGNYTLECFLGGLSAKKSVFIGIQTRILIQPTIIPIQQPSQTAWPPFFWGPNQQPFGQEAGQSQPSLSVCRRTGCSGEICSDHDTTSVCSYLPEYACYQMSRCERLSSGACGWLQTADYNRCVSEVKAGVHSSISQDVGASVNMGKMSALQQVKKIESKKAVKKSAPVVKKPGVKKVVPKKSAKKKVKKSVTKKSKTSR